MLEQEKEIVFEDVKKYQKTHEPMYFTDIYTRIYRECVARIHSYGGMKNRIVPKEDAEDIAQTVMIKVADGLDNLENPVAFFKWFNLIIEHTCSNYWKLAVNNNETSITSLKGEKVIDPDLDDDYVFEQYDANESLNSLNDNERNDIINTALSQLDESTQDVIRKYYFDGLNINEISDETNILPGTVKSKLSRGRATLSQSMEAEATKRGFKLYNLIPFGVLLYLFDKTTQVKAEGVEVSPENVADILSTVQSPEFRQANAGKAQAETQAQPKPESTETRNKTPDDTVRNEGPSGRAKTSNGSAAGSQRFKKAGIGKAAVGAGVSKKVIGGVIAGVAVAGIGGGVVATTGVLNKKIEVQYIDKTVFTDNVTLTGANGWASISLDNAYVTLELSDNGLEEKIDELRDAGKDEDAEKLETFQENGGIQGCTFDVSENLSNGDKVTYTCTYDKALADEMDIKIDNTSITYTVEGLQEGIEFNPFDKVTVAYFYKNTAESAQNDLYEYYELVRTSDDSVLYPGGATDRFYSRYFSEKTYHVTKTEDNENVTVIWDAMSVADIIAIQDENGRYYIPPKDATIMSQKEIKTNYADKVIETDVMADSPRTIDYDIDDEENMDYYLVKTMPITDVFEYPNIYIEEVSDSDLSDPLVAAIKEDCDAEVQSFFEDLGYELESLTLPSLSPKRTVLSYKLVTIRDASAMDAMDYDYMLGGTYDILYDVELDNGDTYRLPFLYVYYYENGEFKSSIEDHITGLGYGCYISADKRIMW